MSEVMICRGCSGSGDEKKKVFKKEIIKNTKTWIVPDIVNNEVYVTLFGAGGYHNFGSSEYYRGGGSGWLNNGTVKLIKGGTITITVGKNGGESTSFGSLLIANGGSGRNGGSGGIYGNGYEFGGGMQGNGGVWGGGGGGVREKGGNGGKYGGGGGCYNYNVTASGGKYGGNGGNERVQAENGTNTIGWTNVDKDISTGEYITGPGLAGSYPNGNRYKCGGGGFGGCGANASYGGGGGYGGNSNSFGGGGYGKGANTEKIDTFSDEGDGGAGYFTKSLYCNGAGWGLYGYGSYEIHDPHSTFDMIYGNSGPGVCVIEYYVWEDNKSK